MGMEVKVVHGDLLDQDVDVIVNAWNRNIIPWWLLLPQGVSGAIKHRAGVRPFLELPWRPLPLGGAVITSAGRLKHKAIIHVAGINLFWQASEHSIRNSVSNALNLATAEGYSSIAFPVIGAGSGSFPKSKALEIMTKAIAQSQTRLRVIIADFDERP